jgi:SAM-dependent methyltransferase
MSIKYPGLVGESESSRERPHYQQVACAFDLAAESYDQLYQQNPVMAWMQSESLDLLRTVLAPGSHLLEIGCGTGAEALALARLGHRVLATDISTAMIDAAQAKAQTLGVGGVTWRVLAAGELVSLVPEFGAGCFDGAYSSFGALNCEPRLEEVAAVLGTLLHPGAVWVASVMGRWCAWEMVWGLVHLSPRQAFRRLARGWTPAGLASPLGRLSVPVRYYTPRDFSRAWAPYFRLCRVRGLPVLLPPPHLAGSLDRRPSLLARLEGLDRRCRDRWPFAHLGDHFVTVMERTG